jgi:hypothetical protein
MERVCIISMDKFIERDLQQTNNELLSTGLQFFTLYYNIINPEAQTTPTG